MDKASLQAMRDEFQKIAAAADVPWRKALLEGSAELLPGITAGVGGILAAKYDRPVSAGAALGGSIGAIPFLLKGRG